MAQLSPEKASITCALEGGLIVLRRQPKPSSATADAGPALMVQQLNMRRAQPSESRALSAWIKERHYTKRTPPGFVVALEFTCQRNRVGAMLLGRCCAPKIDHETILELTRMYFVDEMPIHTESHGLSMMRRHIRTWLPSVRLLVAYSDPSVGHEGTVYEADGWAQFGQTGKKTGYGWRSRPNRNDDPVTSKLRWVRTP